MVVHLTGRVCEMDKILKISKNIIYLKGDVKKSRTYLKKFKPDLIMHAATIASPVYYRLNPIGTALANVDGLKTILNYCKENNYVRILFFLRVKFMAIQIIIIFLQRRIITETFHA